MNISKRLRFVISAIVLCLGFIGINFLDNQYRFLSIGGLSLLSIVLFVWSLWEGLGVNATLVTLILPGLFTVGVGLFWFLLPTTIIHRIPVVLLYGLGVYTLATASNIFIVSTVRKIALARAGKGFGFLLTLLTAFLLYDAIISLKVNILVSNLMVFLISFPIFFQGLWTSILDLHIKPKLIIYPLILSLALVELHILLFFWPVSVVVGSLFLTSSVYVLLGLGQAKLEGRLFKSTVREYVTIGISVFISMFLFTRWAG